MEWEKLKLLGDRVVIQPDPAEEATSSGILLSPTVEKRMFWGTVLAVGCGKWAVDGLGMKRQEMEVKVGDRCLVPRFVGLDFKAVDKTTLILSQSDILAKEE
jgi:chaperonin GroES